LGNFSLNSKFLAPKVSLAETECFLLNLRHFPAECTRFFPLFSRSRHVLTHRRTCKLNEKLDVEYKQNENEKRNILKCCRHARHSFVKNQHRGAPSSSILDGWQMANPSTLWTRPATNYPLY